LMISEGAEQTVSLRIRATRDVWRRLNSGDNTVTIDVSGITEPGAQSVSITTRNISFPRSITALDSIDVQYTSPSAVEFTVSRWASREVPVQGSFLGSVADGYQREEFSFAPETVTVSGQEELVDQVDHALVTVSQENLSATFSENCTYTLVDAEGEPLAEAAQLETAPETVLTTLRVVQLKEVELSVDIVPGGGAAEGDGHVTVDISPATITVSGEAADLAELDSISLGEIDLSQVFGTETRRMTIPLDASLTNVSGPAEATVTVQVEGLSTKTLEVTNINTSNEPDGYHVDVVTQSLTVMVRGTQEAVDAVVASQIRVVADLSDLDLSTGTRTVPVRVYLDGSSEVGVMGEYNISISISRS
ncbi:MAG TPA: hypothetical protein K8V04_05755, partial [Flavonifractor plautii]|nr:hypothetical protein [Flavonifractor plautii]